MQCDENQKESLGKKWLALENGTVTEVEIRERSEEEAWFWSGGEWRGLGGE